MDIVPVDPRHPEGINKLVDDNGTTVGVFPSRDAALRQANYMLYTAQASPAQSTFTAFQPTQGVPSMASPGVRVQAPATYTPPPAPVQQGPQATAELPTMRWPTQSYIQPAVDRVNADRGPPLIVPQTGTQTTEGLPGTKSNASLNFAVHLPGNPDPKEVDDVPEDLKRAGFVKKKGEKMREPAKKEEPKPEHMEHFPDEVQIRAHMKPWWEMKEDLMAQKLAAPGYAERSPSPLRLDEVEAQPDTGLMSDAEMAKTLRRIGIHGGPEMAPGPTGAEAWAETDRKIEK